MVATIYNTSPLVEKKSGTSVDVKVDVKNVTEPDGTGTGTEGDQAQFFIRILTPEQRSSMVGRLSSPNQWIMPISGIFYDHNHSAIKGRGAQPCQNQSTSHRKARPRTDIPGSDDGNATVWRGRALTLEAVEVWRKVVQGQSGVKEKKEENSICVKICQDPGEQQLQVVTSSRSPRQLISD